MDGNSDNYLISDATRRGEATAYQLSAKSKVRLAIEADLAADGSRAAAARNAAWAAYKAALAALLDDDAARNAARKAAKS